jgi:hypothetical protein
MILSGIVVLVYGLKNGTYGRAAPWLEAADKGLATGFRLSQLLGLEAPFRLLLGVVVAVRDVHGSGGWVTYLR